MTTHSGIHPTTCSKVSWHHLEFGTLRCDVYRSLSRENVNLSPRRSRTFPQDQEQAEAVVHIQRRGRGWQARRRVAAIKQSREALDNGVEAEPNAAGDTAVEGGAHKVTLGVVEDIHTLEESQDVQDTEGRHSLLVSKVEEGTTVEGPDEHGITRRDECQSQDETKPIVVVATAPRSLKPLVDDLTKTELADETGAASRIQVRGPAYLIV